MNAERYFTRRDTLTFVSTQKPTLGIFGQWIKQFNRSEFIGTIPKHIPRCKVTGKRKYARMEAISVLLRAERTSSAIKPKRSYPCRHCGYFHLTKLEVFK